MSGSLAALMVLESYEDEREYESDVPLHHLSKNRRKVYCRDTVKKIQIMYIMAAIVWILLIFVCGWFRLGLFGTFILLIPLVVFGINYQNVKHHTIDIEDEMFQGNYLSFGYLLIIVFVNWKQIKHKDKIFGIILIGLILIMLSMVDIWVDKKNFILVKHFRTILQTSSLFLLAYALYIFYLEITRNGKITEDLPK